MRDLGDAAARFRGAYGLASVPGGVHPAWGTANRIVPLGEGYVEFLAVQDRTDPDPSSFGTFMRTLTSAGDHWFTVCLADDDIDATAERLGLSVVSSHRTRPDGVEIRWRGAGLEDPAREPWLPFFLSWDVPDELLPGRSPAAHDVEVSGIAWVEMSGDGDRLSRWTDGAPLPIRMVPEDGREPGIRRVGLETASGGELILEG